MKQLRWTTLILCAGTVQAQSLQRDDHSSALEARRLVEHAIAAMGTQTALDRSQIIDRTLTGVRVDIGQGMRPDSPYSRQPLTIRNLADLRNGRSVDDVTTAILGGYTYRARLFITDRNTATIMNPVNRTAAPSFPLNTGLGRSVPVLYRYPEVFLPFVLTRASSLRSLGSEKLDGRTAHLVSFADPAGTVYTLFFDATTGLLTQTSWLIDDPVYSIAGELQRVVSYSDYRDASGLRIPFHFTVRYGGEALEDLRTTSLNVSPANDSLFQVPQGLVQVPRVPALGEVSKLGQDVYLVRAPYNSVFVVFNDYVLVVEAPVGDALTQETIAAIKRTAPGKPIRYVVPTHYHHDHIGGLRGFVAAGATVVATPITAREAARLVATSRNLRPDALAMNPTPFKAENFTDRRVFADSTHRVELYNIGPSPHVAELVIAYIPTAKVLYEADALDISAGETLPGHDDTVDMARKIEALGLDVQTIIPTHGRHGTIQDLKAALTWLQGH